MSMPIIERPDNPVDRGQSINDLIESVALMETGLSHILNAEGEKIQKVVDPTSTASIDEIIRVNDAVGTMVNNVYKTEMMLQNKLDIIKQISSASGEEIQNAYMFACNTQNTDEAIVPLPDHQVLNGFTVDATNTAFTVTISGIYSISYRLTYVNSVDTVTQVTINDIADPDSIIEEELTQFLTTFIQQLNAGDVISLQRSDLPFPVPTINGVCAFLEVIKISDI